MKTAFAYARVSTKDQEIKGNSIPEQFARIKEFCHQKEINIIAEYYDSDSAYIDDNREKFNNMIKDALVRKPDFIIIDESSRFARTRRKAIETKDILRKHGINIMFVNEPYIDPDSVSALWLEGIQEIKNEATSREISLHVKKGMSRNLKNRDPETGWCYKNGGKAPFGYKTIHLIRGSDSKGKPILKSIWELDNENAPIVRMIIVDLFIKKELSYREIRDELNRLKIKSPRGGFWSPATLTEMLKENRLKQYAGIGFWNREDKKTIGRKYNPIEEWVIVDNAHTPIINKEELAMALDRKKKNIYNAPAGSTRKSNYLLTGHNYIGQPLFTCSNCKGNVVGYGNASNKWKKYICGVNRSRGPEACISKWFVDQCFLQSIFPCFCKQP